MPREYKSIHALNQLPSEEKRDTYLRLVPMQIFTRFGIDRHTLLNRDGECVVDLIASSHAGFTIIEVRRRPGDRDCIFFLELADTSFSQVEITFLIINDPDAERFNTDLDEAGRRTKFGTARRNIPEEIRAMEAGLAPGQVRRGLGLMQEFMALASDFCRDMGHDMIVAEPLAYHNAITFERAGFNYMRGKKKMEEITRGFREGGELYKRLDSSTPFRRKGMESTVRGRSWAIHDGILNEHWKDVEMYLNLDRAGTVDTFPGGAY
ncbi:MAG: hypothetical protein ACYC55_09685 [Candidatus Geothermincolia bacterium]